MMEKRRDHGSVFVNTSTIWIVGGKNSDDEKTTLQTTEYLNVKTGYSLRGPDLPRPDRFLGGCVLAHQDKIYVVTESRTYIYKNTNGDVSWLKEGPPVNRSTWQNACTISNIQNSTYIIAAGRRDNEVEMMDLNKYPLAWQKGELVEVQCFTRKSLRTKKCPSP